MSRILKNYTFSLPIELHQKLKQYSTEGYVPSVNAAVKEALESYVKEIEKQHLYKKMKEASQDSMFMEDLKKSMDDFSFSDFEATKENEQ